MYSSYSNMGLTLQPPSLTEGSQQHPRGLASAVCLGASCFPTLARQMRRQAVHSENALTLCSYRRGPWPPPAHLDFRCLPCHMRPWETGTLKSLLARWPSRPGGVRFLSQVLSRRPTLAPQAPDDPVPWVHSYPRLVCVEAPCFILSPALHPPESP